MMDKKKESNPGLQFAQIGWVVKDIEKSKTFFQEMLGIAGFSPISITHLKEYDATYYGEKHEAENYVTMAYSGGTFIELIQSIAGKSIFQDYINENPTGGVQHIAYSTPLANLDSVISQFGDRGYPVISSFDTPIAKIVFFDTREETGVFTEIMGITKAGEKAVEEMKAYSGQAPDEPATATL